MQTWIQQAELVSLQIGQQGRCVHRTLLVSLCLQDAACFPQIDDPDLGSRMLAALSSAQARGGAKVMSTLHRH